MNLKYIYILFQVLMISTLFSFSQHIPTREKHNYKRQKIEAMKVAFITEKLNLSPEEAEKFWPIYNQYQAKLDEIRKKNREELKKIKQDFEGFSEKEAETVIDEQIEFKQKELDIIKEMHVKLKSVLSAKRIAKLYKTEEQFKMQLLQMVKEKRTK